MTSRNAFLIGGVIVGCVVLCLCGLAVAGLASVAFFYAQREGVSVTATPASPQEVAAQMDAIQQTVIELRGLQPTGSVPREFMTEA
jgi:hypothetical protein